MLTLYVLIFWGKHIYIQGHLSTYKRPSLLEFTFNGDKGISRQYCQYQGYADASPTIGTYAPGAHSGNSLVAEVWTKLLSVKIL